MPNLDNLTNKILDDGRAKAAQLINDAHSKAQDIIDEKIKIASEQKEKIRLKAQDEAVRVHERIVEGKKLEIRDQILDAKHELINRVKTQAVNTLNDLKKEEYFQFIGKQLKGTVLQGEEIIVPKKYKVKDLKELNKILKEYNVSGEITLYQGKREIEGGFILLKDGIEKNYTIDALANYKSNELETEIVQLLF